MYINNAIFPQTLLESAFTTMELPMTSSGSYRFEGCNLRTLGSNDAVLLSRCWKLERVKMTHRPDGQVDLDLSCDSETCACARALKKSKACKRPTSRRPNPPQWNEHC